MRIEREDAHARGVTERPTPDTCRRRREAVGLTRYQLARAAGLNEITIARFEDGVASPRIGTLVAIGKALARIEAERAEACCKIRLWR